MPSSVLLYRGNASLTVSSARVSATLFTMSSSIISAKVILCGLSMKFNTDFSAGTTPIYLVNDSNGGGSGVVFITRVNPGYSRGSIAVPPVEGQVGFGNYAWGSGTLDYSASTAMMVSGSGAGSDWTVSNLLSGNNFNINTSAQSGVHPKAFYMGPNDVLKFGADSLNGSSGTITYEFVAIAES